MRKLSQRMVIIKKVMHGSKRDVNQSSITSEQGHALYLVMVICFLLFLLFAHVASTYLVHVKMVHLNENDVRSHALVQSGLAIWLDSHEQGLISLRDGTVNIQVEEETDQFWALTIEANVHDSDVSHTARVMVNRENKEVMNWQDL